MDSRNGTREIKSVGLFDASLDYSACGVGFLTRKDSVQTHDLLLKAHEALCAVPHRGGMSAEGVGDGAGISIDLSLAFFRKLTGQNLQPGSFAVGNFFMPADENQHSHACEIIVSAMTGAGFDVILERELPVDNDAVGARSSRQQLPIRQWVFLAPPEYRDGQKTKELDSQIHECLLSIEKVAFTDETLEGLHPLSLSARLQVLKGQLSSWEIIPYFRDLSDPDHAVHTMYFHTRFSTNTAPHPSMAQPFRLMAHNGELNTDKK
ncbi:MAG: glutamate synthase large subunit, partial [Planctomycetota bacterium]